MPTSYAPPAEGVDDEYPLTLTTGRRLEFYNTGVQTALYDSARPQEEILEMNPEDASERGIADGMLVRVSSRRGSVELRVRTDPGLYRGLAFMTLHHPDQVNTNVLTIHATDPRSGTAEFKATAVQVEPVPVVRHHEASRRTPVATGE
jgi:formate dehydrogenase major subunit